MMSHSAWTEPTGPLGELSRQSAERARQPLAPLADLQARCRDLPPARSLYAALDGSAVGVIAEVKRASPSMGAIAPSLQAAAQARAYEAGGACAISVLSEPTRFGGSLDDVRDAVGAVAVPVIRKDFLVDPIQLWEARAVGASAALLIARALDVGQLRLLMDTAAACGLAVLVEVRDALELERALREGATIIGVNNRNLETLEIDRTTAPTLLPRIPASCRAIAESGVRGREDIASAANAGADAVLVGSVISAAADATAAVHHLVGVPRQPRGRSSA